jgi:hypothetical protein
MFNMGRGKEIVIKTEKNYNVKIGTIDNKNPKAVYIQISAWGKPKDFFTSEYDSILKNKTKRIKKELFNVIKEEYFHKKKCIVDFNMASSGISFSKKSYMSVELTLFKKEPLLPINSSELVETLSDISINIIDTIFESDEHFNFFKSKN